MKKTLKIFLLLLPAALIVYGCSATPKEDQSVSKNKDLAAVSDTSAPLPPDSAEVSAEIQAKSQDSLRHPQTRIPADRQIKEVQSDLSKTDTPQEEPKKEVKPLGNYAVQMGAFSSDANASKFALETGRKLGKNLLVKFKPENGLFVVQYGEFETRVEAEHAVKELKKKNFKDVFLVKLK